MLSREDRPLVVLQRSRVQAALVERLPAKGGGDPWMASRRNLEATIHLQGSP